MFGRNIINPAMPVLLLFLLSRVVLAKPQTFHALTAAQSLPLPSFAGSLPGSLRRILKQLPRFHHSP